MQAIDMDISFNEPYRPSLGTNTKWLRLRELLSVLTAKVAQAYSQVTSPLKSICEGVYDRRPAQTRSCGLSRETLHHKSPIERLEQVQSDAAALQRFLMDTFQLLNSLFSIPKNTDWRRTSYARSEVDAACVYIRASLLRDEHLRYGYSRDQWVFAAHLGVLRDSCSGGGSHC